MLPPVMTKKSPSKFRRSILPSNTAEHANMTDADSEGEDRFIAIGEIHRENRGRCLHGAGGRCGPHHRCPLCNNARARALSPSYGSVQMSDIPEISDNQFSSAIPAKLRARLVTGSMASGEDIAALRRFVGLSQADFARAMEISVHTLRNWEQGRRKPDGPALALLKIAARHPRIIRENLEFAA